MLKKHLNKTLGSDLGTKHAKARLQEDIRSLMNSLKDHRVYEVVPGRVTDDDDPPVPDVIAVGRDQLLSGDKSPLMDYNKAFVKLQKRRRMIPVTQEASSSLASTDLPTFEPPTHRETPPPPSPGSDGLDNSSPIFGDLLADIEELSDYDDTTQAVIDSEMQQVFADLEEEQATLARVSMRDVALDPDEMTSDEEEDGQESDASSDSDYVDI